MQASKHALPRKKDDSIEDITASKIKRTLWEPSSLDKIQRRLNVEESFYQIDQNEIGADISAVENAEGLIKDIFTPWKVHNLKVIKELRFRWITDEERKRDRDRDNTTSIACMNKLGTNISSQFKNLQRLQLAFDSCKKVDPEDIRKIGFQIGRNLHNLRCLKLNFHYMHNISGKDLQIFISQISKNLINLKELRFYFDNAHGMTGPVLLDIIHNICRYLRKLENFTFRCSSNGPKDTDVEKLLLDIGSSLPKLETLKLDFRWLMEFGRKSIKALNYLFDQHSQHLKGLSLNFSMYPNVTYLKSTWLKEEDYEKIVKNITTKLTNLEKLKLNLGGHLTDQGIKNIAEQIFGSLSKLTHFGLRVFNMEQKITEQGLKAISSVISLKKNTLQQIKLKFSNCHSITNQGFEILINAIVNHLPVLQDLELSFPDCKKITSVGLRSLVFKIIKPSLKLKKLKLNFTSCRGIKGKGLEELLVEIVNRQQSWESVNLVFKKMGDFGKSEDKINQLLASCPLIKWKINNYAY